MGEYVNEKVFALINGNLKPLLTGVLKEAYEKGIKDTLNNENKIIDKEKLLLAKLLDDYSQRLSDDGCGDVENDFWEGWSREERQRFCLEYYSYNGSPDDYSPHSLELPRTAILGLLKHKLLSSITF